MVLRKAVFPVAGLGTRFLPATKANPKEMLPIVDKPLIQYAVEEAVAAGIEELIFVTSSSKRAIEDHFDANRELEATLTARKETELLRLVRDILPSHVRCCYVRQTEQLGLGHAVLCAKAVVGGEPFAVLLADDLINTGLQPGCLQQMCASFARSGCSTIAVQTIATEDAHKYGVIDIEGQAKPKQQNYLVRGIIEKPGVQQAPSNLGVVGRYILSPRIFACLEQTGRGVKGEIQLTDAIAKLLAFESVQALIFQGKRYDCGSKLGYLEATIAYALQHPELAEGVKAFLQHSAQ